MPAVHRQRNVQQVMRWLDALRAGGRTPGLHAAAAAEGVTLDTAASYLRRYHRTEYDAACTDYLSGTRGTGSPTVTPMEPNVPEFTDGTGRLYEVRQGRSGLRVDLQALREHLLDDIKAYRPPAVPPHRPTTGLLHVVSPADLHIGKLAWEPETGEDFDSGIAAQRLREVVAKLLGHAEKYPVERHLFVVGNDLLQVDNLISTTTAGTFQDTDSRYRKMFRLAVRLMRETADMLSESAPVTILTVPGNHDQLASFHVGEVLGAIYDGHTRVAVKPDIRARLYYRHGTTLLGFCHGNDEKHGDLPLVMAQENPEAWSQTTYREFLVGHLHKKREKAFTAGDSYNGVRVVVLPSLTGTDSWHAKKGYIGEPKASESRLYDRGEGLVATFTARAA